MKSNQTQFFGSLAKSFMMFNMGQFYAFPSIVIPSLIGISKHLNPDETVQVTASQSSWLCKNDLYGSNLWDFCKFMFSLASFAHIAHPIGSLISGPVCEKIGRRKAIMMVTIPLIISWVTLYYSQSFPIICLGFLLLGFCFGLKESPTL